MISPVNRNANLSISRSGGMATGNSSRTMTIATATLHISTKPTIWITVWLARIAISSTTTREAAGRKVKGSRAVNWRWVIELCVMSDEFGCRVLGTGGWDYGVLGGRIFDSVTNLH